MQFDETTLPEAVRARLSELRGLDNLASVTVKGITSAGVACLVLPKHRVAEGGGWGMPDGPFILTIPSRPH